MGVSAEGYVAHLGSTERVHIFAEPYYEDLMRGFRCVMHVMSHERRARRPNKQPTVKAQSD